jgi:type IV secretion system protein TrbL
VLGQSGIGNQGYYDTSYSPRGRRPQRRPVNPHAFEPSGHTDSDDQGVANGIPPEAQTAVEEGAFLA